MTLRARLAVVAGSVLALTAGLLLAVTRRRPKAALTERVPPQAYRLPQPGAPAHA